MIDQRDIQRSLLSSSSIKPVWSFHDCLQEALAPGAYSKTLMSYLGMIWLSASFFLVLPFYLFKAPQFQQCNNQHDQSCIALVCSKGDEFARMSAIPQITLTLQFGLICAKDWIRVAYKIAPQGLSFIGLLIYGILGDRKGRKNVLKISWRFYCFGVIVFSVTQTQFLITFGYVISCINCFPSLMIQFVLLFQQLNRKTRFKACLLLLAFLLVGPLICAFLISYLLNAMGLRFTLSLICGLPTLLLSFILNNFEESAIFQYRISKVRAFNIINAIMQRNKSKPFLISLSQSSWRTQKPVQVSYGAILNHISLGSQIKLGFVLYLAATFGIKYAQVSLDDVTNTFFRGLLMNLTTAASNILLIFFLSSLKRLVRYLFLVSGCLFLLKLTLQLPFVDCSQIVLGIICIFIRFVSDMEYSILLIWGIEGFPTIIRSMSLALMLTGYSLATIFVYLTRDINYLCLLAGLILHAFAAYISKYVYWNLQSKMVDLVNGHDFDEHDRFKIL